MFGTLKFGILLWTVLISICHAHLNPPTNLKAEWIDPLNAKVSWKRPKSLPQDCIIKYVVSRDGNEPQRNTETNFLEELLSESPAKWEYSVQAEGTSSSCINQSSSATKVLIETPKPRGVDRDFKCFLYKSVMKCSWTSDPSSPVRLYYRDCGTRTEFKECKVTSNSGPRTVCQLSGNFLQKDLCMLATTSNGNSTFKAPRVLTLPNMKISEVGTDLELTWAPLEEFHSLFNICYSVCDVPRTCHEHSIIYKPFKIRYEKSCQYKILYQTQTGPDCTKIYSDWSEEITYGSTDRTLTVVAIVIPTIVSACVILSCICFRRHKHIICPVVPDPSTIFKEIINGNKEMKPRVPMYTPVQEPVEPIVIVPHIPHSSGPVPT